MIEWKYFHGSNPYKYILDKRTSIDIDDGLDLACARAWLDMDESVSQIDPYSIDNYENRGNNLRLNYIDVCYMSTSKEVA